VNPRAYLSIGDVLSLLREEFPDVTISKIRFLESQGLVNPERSPSGYRKFYEQDVERLSWVLRQQRENFLPLKVIRDRLAQDQRGVPAPAAERDASCAESEVEAAPVVAMIGAASQTPPSGAPAPAEAVAGRQTRANGGSSPSRAADQIMALVIGARTAGRPGKVTGYSASEGSWVGSGTGIGGPVAEAPSTPSPPPHPPTLASVPPASAPSATPPPASAPSATPPPASAPSATPPPASAPSATPPPASAPSATPPPASAPSATPPPASAPSATPPPASAPSVTPPPSEISRLPSETATPSDDVDPGTAGEANSSRAIGHASHASHTSHGTGSPSVADQDPDADQFNVTPAAASAGLTVEELCSASGLSVADLGSLEGFGLIEAMPVAGIVYYDEEALAVAKLVTQFARYGVEPRHLRLYRNAVDREVGLVEQIVTPLLRQRNPEARQRALDAAADMAKLGQGLRASLLRRELRRQLGN